MLWIKIKIIIFLFSLRIVVPLSERCIPVFPPLSITQAPLVSGYSRFSSSQYKRIGNTNTLTYTGAPHKTVPYNWHTHDQVGGGMYVIPPARPATYSPFALSVSGSTLYPASNPWDQFLMSCGISVLFPCHWVMCWIRLESYATVIFYLLLYFRGHELGEDLI